MKKKIIIIIGILLSLYLYYSKEYNVSDDMIRFRVIANSNKNNDIVMKELVVRELSGLLFIKSNNINEVRDNIVNNLENVNKRIENLFEKYNYDKSYNISYGINDFPNKTFLGKKYESGSYESLVVEIGEAKGNNYFCVLYPSLCMIDYKNNKEDNNKFGFKIMEVFKELF